MKKENKSAHGESLRSTTNKTQKEKRTEKKNEKGEKREEGRDVARPRGFPVGFQLVWRKLGGNHPGAVTWEFFFFCRGGEGFVKFVMVTMTSEILNSVACTLF